MTGFFLILLLPALTAILPRLLVVEHVPSPADAVVVLGGDSDGSRLRMGVALFDRGMAPRLLLTGGEKAKWLARAREACPECRLEERPVVWLLGSIDTRTDAQLSLAYCRGQQLRKLLVVTSPYHSRRAQFVFNDICRENGIDVTVVSSGNYGTLLPPTPFWWRDGNTGRMVLLESAKILFWELTPFEEL